VNIGLQDRKMNDQANGDFTVLLETRELKSCYITMLLGVTMKSYLDGYRTCRTHHASDMNTKVQITAGV